METSNLTTRTGAPSDWPVIQSIVRQAAATDDLRVTETVWRAWTDPDSLTQSVVATAGDMIVGFGAVFEISAAGWWLAGPYILPTMRGTGAEAALIDALLEAFAEHGAGILRTASFDTGEEYTTTMQENGFTSLLGYMRMEGETRFGPLGSFIQLTPDTAGLAYNYLQYAPLFRVNRFLEQDNVLDYLNEDRFAYYVANRRFTALGWRQFDMIHGVAIVRFRMHSPYRDALYINYLDAPDDTTLRHMLEALRSAAAAQGLTRYVWKMPLSIGLERMLVGSDWKATWDTALQLYELPIRT